MATTRTPALRTHTLGCKVNQYETEFVRQSLLAAGYRNAGDGEPADLCIVNSCTVTAEGDAKSRQSIRRLHRQNPDARIIVMGCYATRAPREVAALPGVAEVLQDKRELADLLRRLGVVELPRGLDGFSGHRRAFVKVQDGCMLHCSFCIIPLVRPYLQSRPPDDVLDEISHLVQRGFREIVLTGIHLGHYGVEWSRLRPRSQWLRLGGLMRQIARLSGDFRVRLSSIEATEVTRELIDVMVDHPRRICPHLHVSMQSGSDRVLVRMRRRWGARRFVDRCQLVKERLDQPALTTDIIVGFPGETDDDFEDSCRVAREVGFAKIHLFSFSPREGTPAATMGNQVPSAVKQERLGRLAEIERALRRAYLHALQGRALSVLVEARRTSQPGGRLGTACRFVPVEVPGASHLVGKLVTAVAEGVEDDRHGLRIRAALVP